MIEEGDVKISTSGVYINYRIVVYVRSVCPGSLLFCEDFKSVLHQMTSILGLTKPGSYEEKKRNNHSKTLGGLANPKIINVDFTLVKFNTLFFSLQSPYFQETQ